MGIIEESRGIRRNHGESGGIRRNHGESTGIILENLEDSGNQRNLVHGFWSDLPLDKNYKFILARYRIINDKFLNVIESLISSYETHFNKQRGLNEKNAMDKMEMLRMDRQNSQQTSFCQWLWTDNGRGKQNQDSGTLRDIPHNTRLIMGSIEKLL